MYLLVVAMAFGVWLPGRAFAQNPYFPEWLECEAALLTPIPYTPPEDDEIFATDIRLVPGGQYYAPDEPLPDLSSGRYLYQMLSTGGVYLVHELDVARYIQYGDGVWKHEVFGHDHAQRFGKPIDPYLIASGWIIRAFGQVVFISNESGSRRGGPERVNVALRFFRAKGWTIDNYADFYRFGAEGEEASRAISIAAGNAANRGRRHSMTAMQRDVESLEIMADVHTHPDGLRLIALYEELVQTLQPYMRKQSSAEVFVFLHKPSVSRGLNHLASYFAFPIKQARTADGIHHGILRLWYGLTRHQFKPADYVNITGMIFVQGAIETLRSKLTPEDLARLTRVRDGFAALPNWKKPPSGNWFYEPINTEAEAKP